MSEASRLDAALNVMFSNPCGCPEHHAGRPDGTCGVPAGSTLPHAGGDLAVCIPCARCLLDVQFRVHPGRASGSASRARRTG